MIRKILHKILGIDRVITQLNGRVTLIENIVGINSFMANEECMLRVECLFTTNILN
jgi:hypothetical protein